MDQKSNRKIILYRTIFIFIALVSLILGGFNMYKLRLSPTDECRWKDTEKGVEITSVQKRGSAGQAGIRVGDVLLWIAGVNATTSGRAQAALNRQKVGDVVPYLVLREGELIQFDVKIVFRGFSLLYLVMSCVGFIFWAVGLWIVYLRPQDPKARVLFFLFLSFMIFWMRLRTVSWWSFG